MPNPPAPLYVDEDVSVVLAAILKARGIEAVTARDSAKLGLADADQLAFAAAAGRVLLTHNRVDFERLHKEWLGSGRPHAGILIARRRSPPELAARVGRLLSRITAENLRNQLFFV